MLTKDIYMTLLIILPSIISALLISPKSWNELKRQFINWRNKRHQLKELKNSWRQQKKQTSREARKELKQQYREEKKLLKRKTPTPRRSDGKSIILLDIIAFILQFIAVLLVYAIICIAAVSIYSAVRSLNTKVAYFTIWKNFILSYIQTNWKMVIGIPFVCALFARAIKSFRLKVVVSLLLIVAMLCLSLFTSFSTGKILPMESEILSELRKNPVPFETRFNDIAHFRTLIDKGYLPETDEGTAGRSAEKSRPSELDQDINSLNLHQLLTCIYYLYIEDYDAAEPYVQRAYDLCQETEQTNRFDVGEMWYYHGIYFNADSFVQAAEEFGGVERFWNAAGSLWRFFQKTGQEYTYYDLFVENTIKAIESGQSDKTLSYCEDYVEKLDWQLFYDYGCNEGLSQICAVAPDNAFLNIVDILTRVDKGTIREEDKAEVEHLLTIEAYASCPKLLLLHQYYGGDELDKLYNLYLESPSYFEVEDRINLAWFFYRRGEYQVAYSIAKSNDVGEVLIRAESYLMGDLKIDGEALYLDVAEASREEESPYRIDLIKIILENRLGFQTEYSGLSQACKEVFDSGSITGLFIIASLEKEDELYEDCLTHCATILEKITASDDLYYRVQFLRVEALMGLAASPGYEGQRDELYGTAEKILTVIKKTVGSYYVECLERLSDLYLAMGKDAERQEVIKTLSSIRGV